MTKISLVIFAFALCLSVKSFAGTANATLSCNGANGTLMTGSVPGDEAEFDLTIKLNGKSAHLYSDTNQQTGALEGTGEVTVVQDLPQGVYTLLTYRQQTYGFVQMYALPKTVVFKRTSNGYVATFSAKLSFNLSEIAMDTQSPIVKCSMRYQL